MIKEEFEEINEPLSEYFKSEKHLKSFKTLTISSFEEMEMDNLHFNAILKPVQRLELLRILNDRFFSGISDDNSEKKQKKLVFENIDKDLFK